MLLMWTAIEMTRKIIYAASTLEENRFKPEYFTRNWLMPLYKLLKFLLSMYKTSSQTALIQFFENEDIAMSQQALSKARSKLDHSPFVKLFTVIRDAFYAEEHLANGVGLNLTAGFGSQYSLITREWAVMG